MMRRLMLTKKENLKNDVKNGKTPKTATSSTDSCCQPTKESSKAYAPTNSQSQTASTEKKNSTKTRITVKHDAGYPNHLYIRGQGANLSWDKGQPLTNVKADEWVWETDTHFNQCEFKILINDKTYEIGDNHLLNAGASLLYKPQFS